jgi:hypothetical protein
MVTADRFVATWQCNRCGAEHRGTVEEHKAERWLSCGPISREICDGSCGERREGWDWKQPDGSIRHMVHPGVTVCRRCVLEAAAVQPLRERYALAHDTIDSAYECAALIRGGEFGVLSGPLDEALSQIEGLCVPFDGPACRLCGCTQELGCEAGCWWVEPDLCSECATPEQRASGMRLVIEP